MTTGKEGRSIMRKYANFTIIMLVDLVIVILWGIDKFVRPLLPIHISPTVVLVIVITLIGFAITILQWERMWEERIGLPPPKFDSDVLGILPVIAMTVPLFSFVLPIMERLRKHFVDELLFKDGMNAYVTD